MKIRIPPAIATLVGVVLFSGLALANGRFPRAARLIENASDPNKLTLAATYGLLVTEDRGKHWYHVCEAAFSFQMGFSVDPLVSPTADGSLLLSAQAHLTRSIDRGCGWTRVLEPPSGTVPDFTTDPANPDRVIALVSTFEAGNNVARLQESTDGGVTWKPIGKQLPAPIVFTIDLDPKNPMRIYATASMESPDPMAPRLLLVSNDHGDTWVANPIPQTNSDVSPYIAAIHPTDGNKIFVRTDSWKRDPGGQDLASDALLYSEDGGKTWTELLHPSGNNPNEAGAKLLGFAISPDGSTVLAGYGDPKIPTRIVDPDQKWMGVYKSSSDGRYGFGANAPDMPTPLLKVPSTCLKWTAKGIYGCFAPDGEPQYLGFTSDPNLAPASMTTLMRTTEVLGVPPCCLGRATSECVWNDDCRVLGACDGGAPTGGGMCGGGGGRGGGTTVDAGSTGGMGGAGAGAGGATGGAGAVPTESCGCRLLGEPTNRRAEAVAWLIALLVARARRRST